MMTKSKNGSLVLFVIVYLGVGFCLCNWVCRKLKSVSMEKRVQLEATKAISESFERYCQFGEYGNLNDWQKECKEKWSLDYIAWSIGEDFMIDEFSNGESILIYGVWKGELSAGEIYFRKEKLL